MAAENGETCDFCGHDGFVRREEELAFQQETDRGNVHCRVRIRIVICKSCGARSWGEDAEAAIAAAVRQEYERKRA